jgi:hypothetical protein
MSHRTGGWTSIIIVMICFVRAPVPSFWNPFRRLSQPPNVSHAKERTMRHLGKIGCLGTVSAVLLLLLGLGTPLAARAADTLTVCSSGCDYAAIQAAIAAAMPGDVISLAAGTYTEAGTIIDKDVMIIGAGATTTIVQAAAAPSTAANRVFSVNPGVTATIADITIRYGQAMPLDDDQDSVEHLGGGIINAGTLTVMRSIIADNSSFSNGGGIFNLSGANLTVSDTTIVGNTANYGAGIYNGGGTLTMTNSTISSNTGVLGTGGIMAHGGTATITSGTIANNYSKPTCCLHGAVTAFRGRLLLSNTIIATQAAGLGCAISGGTITSLGHNLDSEGTCALTGLGDQSGSNGSPLAPGLGPLQDNGGATLTHALLPGSPAVDAGTCGGSAISTDQRGVARPQGVACDIGAYELVATVADTTPPSSMIVPSPSTPDGDNGWYVSSVHVTILSTDNHDGSGVEEIRCILDPPSPPTSFDTMPVGCAYTGAGADVASDGQHTIFAASTDVAGNEETPVSLSFTLDGTVPANVRGDPSHVADHNDWYNHPVDIAFQGTDALSGIDQCTMISYSGPDSASASVTGTCMDHAGNTSALATSTVFRYDATAPILSPSVTPSQILLNGNATVIAGAEDGVSGIDTQACDALDMTTVGSKLTICTASDRAGNQNSASVAYTVQYMSSGLCNGDAGHQVLQPVNANGNSVFKYGSTVPIKFRVCDANGISIGTPSVVTSFLLVGTSTSSGEINEMPIATTTDTAFRWDASARQWIFNLSTKNLQAGKTYYYRINLNDGTPIDFHFGLR